MPLIHWCVCSLWAFSSVLKLGEHRPYRPALHEVHIAFRIRVSVFSGICLGVGFLGHVVTLFCVLRNLHIVFQSGCTNIYIPTDCSTIPFSPYCLQTLGEGHSHWCEVILPCSFWWEWVFEGSVLRTFHTLQNLLICSSPFGIRSHVLWISCIMVLCPVFFENHWNRLLQLA